MPAYRRLAAVLLIAALVSVPAMPTRAAAFEPIDAEALVNRLLDVQLDRRLADGRWEGRLL